jgi:DNA-binding CsgD family transcriptional regulator
MHSDNDHRARIRESISLALGALGCSHERLGELLGCDSSTVRRNLAKRSVSRYMARKWTASTRQAACLRALAAGVRMGLDDYQAYAQARLRAVAP